MGLVNREGYEQFGVDWAWERDSLETGMTGVLRVKNEARSMPWVLPPLLQACDHVVVIDNESDDGTAEMAKRAAAAHGLSHRLRVTEYPFPVSRCGAEHLSTPEDSVHSLAYFYNWSFSHVRTTYSMKWDGDMVLTREGAATFADLAWQLGTTETVVTMPRHPLFVESERVAYLDVGLRNIEPWIYPMGPEYTFVKAFEWELRLFPDGVRRIGLPGGLCVELKYLDSDEFSHWTGSDSFATSARTVRKRREWAVFNALANGEPAESLESVVRIEAPPGVHVIDYVTQTWLPQADRPIVKKPVNA